MAKKSKDLFSDNTFISDEGVASPVRKQARINADGYPKIECDGKSKPLSNRAFGIGRDKRNALIIADPAASKFHAVVTFLKGTGYLQDSKSTNGTFLNGKKIPDNRKIKLKNGDKIRVGNTVLTFKQ